MVKDNWTAAFQGGKWHWTDANTLKKNSRCALKRINTCCMHLLAMCMLCVTSCFSLRTRSHATLTIAVQPLYLSGCHYTWQCDVTCHLMSYKLAVSRFTDLILMGWVHCWRTWIIVIINLTLTRWHACSPPPRLTARSWRWTQTGGSQGKDSFCFLLEHANNYLHNESQQLWFPECGSVLCSGLHHFNVFT